MCIFLLNFLAVLCFLQTKYTSHSLFFAIGIFLELVTLGIDILLVLRIKSIRDDISGVTSRPAGQELDHEAAYIPLGLWSLSVFTFWFVSNLSILYWYNWSVGTWGPEPYLVTNIILLFLVVFILWHPQMNFDWGVEPVFFTVKGISGTGLLEKTQKYLPRLKKGVTSPAQRPNKCPVCGAKIIAERRACSNCGKPRIFTWCKISEGYIVTCPHCKAQTSYGKPGCLHCGKPITRSVRCTCGTEHEIRDWDFVRTIG